MSENYEFDIFLAHHSDDKPFVLEISTKLKQRGLKPWVDEEQIAPGRSFQQAIQQAIPTVKTAAIILGINGVGRWQEWEILSFFSECVEKDTNVIPVLLPGVDEVPDNLPFLRQLRWINFSSSDDTTALELLIWGITDKRLQEDLKDDSPSKTNTQTIQPSSFDVDTHFNQARTKDELNKAKDKLDKLLEDDYFRLESHLKSGFWKDADQVTTEIMLKIAKRENKSDLDENSLEIFPISVLLKIDNLWRRYSNQKFGFSVQKEIFHELDEDVKDFAERVGWKYKTVFGDYFSWKERHDLKFGLDSAPSGHLPWSWANLRNHSLDIRFVGNFEVATDGSKKRIETLLSRRGLKRT